VDNVRSIFSTAVIEALAGTRHEANVTTFHDSHGIIIHNKRLYLICLGQIENCDILAPGSYYGIAAR